MKDRKKLAAEIMHRLRPIYKKEPDTALEHIDALQLLIATILSAQCTDVQVNKVTEKLFKKYRTLEDYANADRKEFEQDIRSTGFYRNKAKNIIGAAKMVEKDFGGKIPDNMEDLTKLPGVARKTANIVLSGAFHRNEGIAIDTHVKRLTQRIGLTDNKDPNKIEKDLLLLVDRKDWWHISNTLIWHGRNVCISRKPLCDKCQINDICRSAFKPELWKKYK
jgi:endonuclease-3